MKPRTVPLRRSPLRRVSTKRAKELREYAKKRERFLLGASVCAVWLSLYDQCEGELLREIFGRASAIAPRPTEVHHTDKRHGKRLNDESKWLAVSAEAHRWIHGHASEARRLGFLV